MTIYKHIHTYLYMYLNKRVRINTGDGDTPLLPRISVRGKKVTITTGLNLL